MAFDGPRRVGSGAPSDGSLVAMYAVGVAAMVGISAASVAAFGVRPEADPPLRFRGERWLEGLFRFDGGWYAGIAEHGYSYVPGRQSNVAFFPAYPVLMRVIGGVIGDTVNAGMLITAVAGATSVVLAKRWMGVHRLSPVAIRLGIASLFLSPYAWFLYAVTYSDALFLALALGAAMAVERDRILLAGLLTAAATADRSTGIALAVGLIVLVAERRGALVHDPRRAGGLVQRFALPNRVVPSRLRRRDAWIVLGLGGTAAYAAFLQITFGRALLFVDVQREWGQGAGWAVVLKDAYWWEVRHLVHRSLVLTLTLQAVLLLVALALVPVVGRRFGWGYGVFQLLLVAFPALGTKDFMGSGRYLLVLFPGFALVGERLADCTRAVRRVSLVASATTLVVLAAGFAHGMFLA